MRTLGRRYEGGVFADWEWYYCSISRVNSMVSAQVLREQRQSFLSSYGTPFVPARQVSIKPWFVLSLSTTSVAGYQFG